LRVQNLFLNLGIDIKQLVECGDYLNFESCLCAEVCEWFCQSCAPLLDSTG